jgi:hypothetical protein
MPIYDVTILGDTATGMQSLPAGGLGVYTITLLPKSGLMISLLHVAFTEDFSVRVWFSETQGGESITMGPFRVIPLTRLPTVFVLYDPAVPINIPSGAIGFPISPGNYIMNFLNLANAENIFSFKVANYTGIPSQ